nr:hypothetical protein [Mycobacterium sp. UM_NZ2]
MTRDEFLTLLETGLANRGATVSRYTSGPDITDLELALGEQRYRLRVVRTAETTTRASG